MSSRLLLLLAAVAAVLTGAAARAQEPPQQSPTFNSATSAVMVDVVVRDRKGRPVSTHRPTVESSNCGECRSIRSHRENTCCG